MYDVIEAFGFGVTFASIAAVSVSHSLMSAFYNFAPTPPSALAILPPEFLMAWHMEHFCAT